MSRRWVCGSALLFVVDRLISEFRAFWADFAVNHEISQARKTVIRLFCTVFRPFRAEIGACPTNRIPEWVNLEDFRKRKECTGLQGGRGVVLVPGSGLFQG